MQSRPTDLGPPAEVGLQLGNVCAVFVNDNLPSVMPALHVEAAAMAENSLIELWPFRV